MRNEREIQEKLRDVEKAEQLSYPNATIAENAPLALIQLSLETRRDILRWVLEE